MLCRGSLAGSEEAFSSSSTSSVRLKKRHEGACAPTPTTSCAHFSGRLTLKGASASSVRSSSVISEACSSSTNDMFLRVERQHCTRRCPIGKSWISDVGLFSLSSDGKLSVANGLAAEIGINFSPLLFFPAPKINNNEGFVKIVLTVERHASPSVCTVIVSALGTERSISPNAQTSAHEAWEQVNTLAAPMYLHSSRSRWV